MLSVVDKIADKISDTKRERLSKILEVLSPLRLLNAHLCTLMQIELFGCLDGKFKSQKVSGNGILFPEFTSCCWLYENAS